MRIFLRRIAATSIVRGDGRRAAAATWIVRGDGFHRAAARPEQRAQVRPYGKLLVVRPQVALSRQRHVRDEAARAPRARRRLGRAPPLLGRRGRGRRRQRGDRVVGDALAVQHHEGLELARRQRDDRRRAEVPKTSGVLASFYPSESDALRPTPQKSAETSFVRPSAGRVWDRRRRGRRRPSEISAWHPRPRPSEYPRGTPRRGRGLVERWRSLVPRRWTSRPRRGSVRGSSGIAATPRPRRGYSNEGRR